MLICGSGIPLSQKRSFTAKSGSLQGTETYRIALQFASGIPVAHYHVGFRIAAAREDEDVRGIFNLSVLLTEVTVSSRGKNIYPEDTIAGAP
jgi:hypothetical protein